MGGSLLAVLAAFALLAGTAAIPAAPVHAADLFLTGEREIYLAVDKLNAMGRLPGLLANTRPYSVAAVRAALDNAAAAGQGIGFDTELARWVSYATKPAVLVRGTAGIEADEKRETHANEGGIPTPKGVSGRLSILAREETTPFVSAHASAAAFFGEGGETGTRVGESAIEIGLPSAALQIGKIATWYGPGRLGALLFTNNAQSYPGIRLHNPVPIAVPGLFSFLGNVQYDLFLARLESDRPIPNPLLFGMRLAARPSRYLELGVSRSMIYGGEGHDSGLSAWWDAFEGENTQRSRRQRAGQPDRRLRRHPHAPVSFPAGPGCTLSWPERTRRTCWVPSSRSRANSHMSPASSCRPCSAARRTTCGSNGPATTGAATARRGTSTGPPAAATPTSTAAGSSATRWAPTRKTSPSRATTSSSPRRISS